MCVFDAESDGFFPTKFYVVSYWDGEKTVSLTSHDEMRSWFLQQKVLIGHNIIRFDIPHIERVLGIKIKAKLVDTLALSWYLFPNRHLHGLESWGTTFGVPKPPIDDWNNLSVEEYVHRCEEDVKINQRLWDLCKKSLRSLYDSDDVGLPVISYLMFKLDCAREQEELKWKLDKEWCQNAIDKLEAEKIPKTDALRTALPPVVKQVLRNPPTKPFKKDGTLSVEGAKWRKYLSDQGLTNTHSSPIYVVMGEEIGNPDSPEQIKNWLFILGWKPETFKFVKGDDKERQIPQIKKDKSPELCPSVLELADQAPAILALEGLSVINHRLGILKGFLKNVDENGYLQARVQGFTNTLRFKHTEIVNLPGVDKPYGLEVRGCLVSDVDCTLVGTDMVSLEDTTKKHYMWDYDPEYVTEMSAEGFDPHLDLAIKAGVLSKEDFELYKLHKDDKSVGDNLKTLVVSVTTLRKSYKITNYSAVYGVGKENLARELKSSVSFAKQILDSYWKRNWAVRKIAEDAVTKTVDGQMWLYNPVSKFWYSLRFMKDIFSTLNQGTGVYCFDSWIKECRKLGSKICGQFHDESVTPIKDGEFEATKALQQKAMDAVNNKLKLNVTLRIEAKQGVRYSDIH